MRIHNLGIQNQQLLQATQGAVGGGKSGDFAQMLMDVLKEVNESQNNASELQNSFMTGQPVEYHDLMIAMQKASTALDLTLQVRNQIIAAYQEFDRMQV